MPLDCTPTTNSEIQLSRGQPRFTLNFYLLATNISIIGINDRISTDLI